MSTETLNALTFITQLVSALATVSAVIVALYLSKDARRIRLVVSAGIRSIVQEGQRIIDAPEYVKVEAVNISLRPVTITGFGWELGFLKKQHFIQSPDVSPPNSSMPCQLQDGQTAHYYIPVQVFLSNADKILSFLMKGNSKRNIKGVKVVVYTASARRPFKATIEESLQKMLLEEIEKRKAT